MVTTVKVNELTLTGDIQSGDVLVGERVNGTTVRLTYVPPTGVSDGDKGDITVSGSGTVYTIDNDVVTYAKMQNVSATDKLLGRSTAGAGDVEEIALTAAGRALIDDADVTAQRSTLGLGTLATQSGTFSGTSSGTNTGDQTITLTGDVTGAGVGSFAATIANSAVTLAKQADIATASIMGRNTAGTGVQEVLSASTTKTLLSLGNVENTALSTWAGSTNITTVGTVGTGTWQGTAVTVTYGGSGRGTATAYAPLVGGITATGAHQSVASGSTGQIFQSAGNAAVPTWSTPTYPSTSGTARKILVSNGTNNIYSTETYATPGAAANFNVSDGTNWINVGSTGTNTVVRNTSPTLVSPLIGTPASGTLTNCTGLKASGSIFSGVFVTRGSNQSIPDVTFTKVQLDTETYDTENTFTNYKWTPNVSGKYLVSASIYYSALAINKYAYCSIYKNGSAVVSNIFQTGGLSTDLSPVAVGIITMNGSTDYIELFAYHDSGGAKNITSLTNLSGFLIGV